MSRGGRKGYDFAHLLPTDLFSAIIPGELTIELIDDIIYKSILVINQIAGIKHKQFVSLEENCIVSNVIGVEKQTIEFIKQIKGEIPLPHLQEILETFIQGNNRNKTKGKERVLKR